MQVKTILNRIQKYKSSGYEAVRFIDKNNGYLYVITRVSGAFYLKTQLNDALIESYAGCS